MNGTDTTASLLFRQLSHLTDVAQKTEDAREMYHIALASVSIAQEISKLSLEGE